MWRCAIVLAGLIFWQARGESLSIEGAQPASSDWTARFSRLPADQAARLRRDLLEGLPKRLVTAARIVLETEAYEEWKDRYAQPILTLARGERLSATLLFELWSEADRLEQLAIRRLSRAYRMQVYQTYRDQRTQFDRRQNAWRDVEAAWIAGGGWPEEQPRLIEWLKTAIWASRPGTLTALPPAPTFAPARSSKTRKLQITKSPNQTPRPSAVAPRTTEPSRRSSTSSVASAAPRVSPPFIPREAPQAAAGRVAGSPSMGAPVGPNPTGQPARRVASRSHAVEPGSAARPHDPVRVNIDEIAVRVAGFNLALAALEQQLDQEGPFTIPRLTRLVEQLGDLTTRHGDMRPYYQYVSAGEVRRLGELRSCITAIRLAAARIVARQRELHDGPQSQREEIERLSRRLAEIAAAYHAAEAAQPRPHAPRGDASQDAPRRDEGYDK